MSGLSIAAYLPFHRIKIVQQKVTLEATEAHIQAQPDKRFQRVCHRCGSPTFGVYSWTQRKVRDLNMTTARLWVVCRYGKVFCAHCHGVYVGDLQLFHPYLRVTVRLARYIYQLCQMMTLSEVAGHLGLNWKTVKDIDNYLFWLERESRHQYLAKSYTRQTDRCFIVFKVTSEELLCFRAQLLLIDGLEQHCQQNGTNNKYRFLYHPSVGTFQSSDSF